MATSLLEVKGIGPASVKLLAETGINSAEDLADAKLGRVIAIPGFSELRANRVMQAARDLARPPVVATGKKLAKEKTKEKPGAAKKSPGKKVKKEKKAKAGQEKLEKKSQKGKTVKPKKIKKAEKKGKSSKKSGRKK